MAAKGRYMGRGVKDRGVLNGNDPATRGSTSYGAGSNPSYAKTRGDGLSKSASGYGGGRLTKVPKGKQSKSMSC